MTEATSHTPAPLQLYVLDDRFMDAPGLSRHFPPDTVIHRFDNSESMLDHLSQNPVSDAAYELITDTIFDNEPPKSAYPRKHFRTPINVALNFAEMVTGKGAKVSTIHVWSGYDVYAETAAQDLSAVVPTLHVDARIRTDFAHALWDSATGVNPAIARLRAEAEKRREENLKRERSLAIQQLDDDFKELDLISGEKQILTIYKAAKDLASLQVAIPADAPNMRFEEGCGEPQIGHISYSLEEARQRNQKGQSSILVVDPFDDSQLDALQGSGVVGLVCLNEEIKGHLSIILGARGISALVNPKEGDVHELAMSGEAVTLDPTNQRLAKGHYPIVTLNEPLTYERFKIDLRQGAHSFLRLVEQEPMNEDAPKQLPERQINASGHKDIWIAGQFHMPIGLLRSEHFWMDNQDGRELMQGYLLERGNKTELTERFNIQCKMKSGAIFTPARYVPAVTFRLLDVSPQELFDAEGLSEFRARYGAHDPRGVQLAKLKPELYATQITELVKTFDMMSSNPDSNYGHNWLTLLVPNTANKDDIEFVRDIFDNAQRKGRAYRIRLGTMIETAEACRNISEIAPLVDYLSFGTNDLTADTLGISRYDRASVTAYMAQKRFKSVSPFIEIDDKVRSIVSQTMTEAVAANPTIEMGWCGAHAADLRSRNKFRRELDSPAFNSISTAPTFANLLTLPLMHYARNVTRYVHDKREAAYRREQGLPPKV